MQIATVQETCEGRRGLFCLGLVVGWFREDHLRVTLELGF